MIGVTYIMASEARLLVLKSKGSHVPFNIAYVRKACCLVTQPLDRYIYQSVSQ